METPPGAVLIVHSGVSDAGVVPLENERHILGRAPVADVALENPYVSRRHAEIAYDGQDYFIRDLGSKNGTYVDGRAIGPQPVKLRGSEVIELGQGQVVATFGLGSSTVTLPSQAGSRDDGAGRGSTTAPQPSPSRTRGLVVDAARREVIVHDEVVSPPLSRKEFDVLALLYERAGQACSKDEIAARGWPERPTGAVSDQEISQCVHRIRRRVEEDQASPKFIISIRGFGYRLIPDG